MKKLLVAIITSAIFISGCATVQSVIKSTFPYTSTLTLPAGTKSDAVQSISSTTSSFDQIFGNQNGTSYIREVRVASVRLDASNPTTQNLGVFKSVKIFIANGTSEVMVASRNEVGENIGNNLVLDIDNSRLLDDYVKGSNLKVRMEYVLRNSLTSEISVRAAINFSSLPNPK